ncbi:MAG: DUF3043 domain-containing protein [Streptosporangiaceae bacterium]|nr:DUF3043 domain-containing protein [Streptosporangiaceae bacterium]MBV9853978.1 DUF3043 domain-containing protein [Streptosporangiaceae bacterium]
MFRRRSAGATGETAHDAEGTQKPETPAETRPPAEAGKGRPTPKRSEAEKRRYQPITGPARAGRGGAGGRTPETRTRDRTERARRYDAMKRGEEWALNPRDRGPVRGLARDYVDSRRRPSEYYMYVLVLLLVALLSRSKTLNTYVSPFVLVLIVVVAIDGILMRRSLKRLVAERLPGGDTKGLTVYALMRALQIRRFRMPAPRLHPGDKF